MINFISKFKLKRRVAKIFKEILLNNDAYKEVHVKFADYNAINIKDYSITITVSTETLKLDTVSGDLNVKIRTASYIIECFRNPEFTEDVFKDGILKQKNADIKDKAFVIKQFYRTLRRLLTVKEYPTDVYLIHTLIQMCAYELHSIIMRDKDELNLSIGYINIFEFEYNSIRMGENKKAMEFIERYLDIYTEEV